MKEFYDIEIRTDDKEIVEKLTTMFKENKRLTFSTIRISKDIFFF